MRTLQGTEMADTEEDSGLSCPWEHAAPRPEMHPPPPPPHEGGRAEGRHRGQLRGTRGSEQAGGSPHAQHGRLSMYLQPPSCP